MLSNLTARDTSCLGPMRVSFRSSQNVLAFSFSSSEAVFFAAACQIPHSDFHLNLHTLSKLYRRIWN
jgi:hypothetical protein